MTEYRIYQAKHKNQYIETINNKESMKWLFDKTFDFEVRYSKDLFDFNKDELLEFFKDRNMSHSTLITNRTYISKYYEWAIKKGYKRVSKNAADEISRDELKEIAKPNKDLLDIDEINQIVNKGGYELKNEQDRLLVYLIFLGVGGNKAHELINLKFDHIDYNRGIIRLSELDPIRKDLPIDDYCVELIKSTKKELEYVRYMDKDSLTTTNTLEEYELNESDYIFRKTGTGIKSDDVRLSYQGLLRRLRRISSFIGEELNIKRIRNSGIVYAGKQIIDAGYELHFKSKVVEKSIFERYNVTTESGKYKLIKMIEKELPKVYREPAS